MMNWMVVKTGIEVFDLLHAYGLGVVLAWISGTTLELRDAGLTFVLESPQTALPEGGVDLLDDILCLPSVQQVQEERNHKKSDAALPLANLDGLLAATLTVPGGKRSFSVADLLKYQHRDPSTVARGLAKVQGKREEWKRELSTQLHGAPDWVGTCSQEYAPSHPCLALPAPRVSSGITAR